MRGPIQKLNVVQAVFVVALALMLGACDADSPTAPDQTPNPPAASATTTGFAISVSLSPRTVEVGDGTTVTVTVVARRTDTNQFVPEGSTAVLSTTSGLLTNSAGNTSDSLAIAFGVNGTAQATLTAPTETAVIRAQIQQSLGEATLQVNEAPVMLPLSVQTLVPNFGPPAGGTSVRIEGTGFSAPAEVTFNGVFAQIVSISSSSIRVVTPAQEVPAGQNLAATVGVEVNIGEEGQAADSLAAGFIYTRNSSPTIPKIISVTPTSGPNEGGTPVTIFGEGFGSEVQVYFGAASRVEAEVNDVSPTRILATTPPATGQNGGNRNSTVTIEVVDLRSGFVASKANAFQYGGGDMFISSATPVEGTYFGGTLVTIFGSGFEGPVAVEFGGRAQQPVSVSGTEVVARSVGPVEISACNRPSGPFAITNIETNENFTSSLTFTYRPVEPRIGGLSPNETTADVVSGAIVFPGATTLTMTGAGFDRQGFPPLVTFGGERSPGVTITSLDPEPFYEGHGVGDVMTVVIPDAPLPFPEEECTVGSATGVRYTEQRVAVVVTNRDTGCSDTLTGAFTYLPNDTSCRIAPVAEFSFSISGMTVTVTDLSSNATSIQWDFGDGTVQGGTPGETVMHPYAAPGTYGVTLTASNTEGSDSITKDVVIP